MTTELPTIFADVLKAGKKLGYNHSPRTQTPWSHDGYVYATAGIIGVRTKSLCYLLARYRRTDPPPPNPDGLGWEADGYLDEPLPLPTEPVDAARVWAPCPECSGSGVCPHCDDGQCGGCEGDKGTWHQAEPIWWCGYSFPAAIVRLLQDHRALVYPQEDEKQARVRFTVGDVEGIAMARDTNAT